MRFSRNILLLLILSACSIQEIETSHSFQIYEENGITIAETTGGPKYEGELFEYEPVLKINQDERQLDSIIGSLQDKVLMDEDGFIYIVDNRPPRVVCFDPDGNYSHDIGRAGQGPGEFQSLRLISVNGGVVTTYDRTLLRLSLFRTDGTFIRSLSLTNRIRTLLPDEIFISPEGSLVLVRDENTFEYQAGINTGWKSAVIQVVTVDEDTLVALSTDRVITDVTSTRGGSRHYFRCFPRAIYVPSEGIFLTTGSDPQIDVYDLSGHLRRVIKIDLSPDPVINQERTAIRSFLRQKIVESEDDQGRERAGAMLDNATFSDPKAFWQGMSVDEDGYIWATYPGEYYWMDLEILRTEVNRIISPQGEYLGDTQFPDNTFMCFITRGHLIGCVYDGESESIDFVVFRIRSRVAGLSYP